MSDDEDYDNYEDYRDFHGRRYAQRNQLDENRLEQIRLREMMLAIFYRHFQNVQIVINEFNPTEYDSFFDIPHLMRANFDETFNQIIRENIDDVQIYIVQFVEYYEKRYINVIVEICQFEWLRYYKNNYNRDKIIATFNNPLMTREYLEKNADNEDCESVSAMQHYLVDLFSTVMNCDPIIIEWLENLQLINFQVRTELIISLATNRLFEKYVERIDQIRDEQNQKEFMDFHTLILYLLEQNLPDNYYQYIINIVNTSTLKYFLEIIIENETRPINHPYIYFASEQDLDESIEFNNIIRNKFIHNVEISLHNEHIEIQREIQTLQNTLIEKENVIEQRRIYFQEHNQNREDNDVDDDYLE